MRRDGFAVRGARVEALQGAPVATAVYEVRRHVVDVFAWPSGEGDSDLVWRQASKNFRVMRRARFNWKALLMITDQLKSDTMARRVIVK